MLDFVAKAEGFVLIDKDGTFIPGTEKRNKNVIQSIVDKFSVQAGAGTIMVPWSLCAGKAEPEIHRILVEENFFPALPDYISPADFREMARTGYASTPADHSIREKFVENLLDLQGNGVYSAIVTSSDADVVRTSLAKAFDGMDVRPEQLFSLILTKTEVLEAGLALKPSKDPYEMAYAIMQDKHGSVPKERVSILEDSPAGVIAGWSFFDDGRIRNVHQFVDDTPPCDMASHFVTTVGECCSIIRKTLGMEGADKQAASKVIAPAPALIHAK